MHCGHHHHHHPDWRLLYLARRLHSDDDPPVLPRLHLALAWLVSLVALMGAGIYIALAVLVVWALLT